MKGEWGISDFITTVTAEMCVKLEICQRWDLNNNSDSYGTTTDMSVSSLCLTSALNKSRADTGLPVHTKSYELKINTFLNHLLLMADIHKCGYIHKKLSFSDQALLTSK